MIGLGKMGENIGVIRADAGLGYLGKGRRGQSGGGGSGLGKGQKGRISS